MGGLVGTRVLKPLKTIDYATQITPHLLGDADNVKSRASLQPIRLFCPYCKAQIISTNTAFQMEDLDKICKCKSCQKGHKVSMWKCCCGVKWHTCDRHRTCVVGKAHQSMALDNAQETSKNKNGAKRKLGPLTPQQLEAHDHKRIRCDNHGVLPVTLNMLSPKLKIRFAHLIHK